MKTNVKRLLFAAPILAIFLIAFNSFTTDGNRYANGGGIAGGIHFNFNGVEQKDGTFVGHMQWDGNFYRVDCVQWTANNVAILFTNEGLAFEVTDNGEGSSSDPDTISDPVAYYNSCGIGEVLEFTSNDVTSGNIQVK